MAGQMSQVQQEATRRSGEISRDRPGAVGNSRAFPDSARRRAVKTASHGGRADVDVLGRRRRTISSEGPQADE